jgi:hypothetical protein
MNLPGVIFNESFTQKILKLLSSLGAEKKAAKMEKKKEPEVICLD